MVRTQIYLTEEQQKTLRRLVSQTGRKQSELIREAIDRYVAAERTVDYASLVRSGAGLWRERTDLPDFDSLRSEFDRNSHG
jgi:hypothetical protein